VKLVRSHLSRVSSLLDEITRKDRMLRLMKGC
jgi:hypothetical protein